MKEFKKGDIFIYDERANRPGEGKLENLYIIGVVIRIINAEKFETERKSEILIEYIPLSIHENIYFDEKSIFSFYKTLYQGLSPNLCHLAYTGFEDYYTLL